MYGKNKSDIRSNKKYLITLGGPTAVGKTHVSQILADHLSCPILSADSRQFYKEMKIGTAKPDPISLKKVRHYFIDSLSIHDKYSVGQYETDSLKILADIYKNHSTAIMTGGSGLYFKAVTAGLDVFPSLNDKEKEEFELLWKEKGIEVLQYELIRKDPEYAKVVDLSNPHRLIRALSVIKVSGRPFSSFTTGQIKPRKFDVIRISLMLDRNILYDRINRRTDKMIRDGLIDEARKLYVYRQLNSLNTVGYKELFHYFDGQIKIEEAIDKIKQHTRNYAKRQITWFSNQENWASFSPENTEGIIHHIQSKMKDRK